ncbi:MAG TPA: four helix bundle protein [Bacteroidota bacterium]|nr:four helix bundle protein [Bacteroidota bacterium]
MVSSHRELDVYKNAMDAAMTVFKLTKGFPADERFSLTDQIRRSTRSVCTNIAEAWRKRRYRAAFISKLNDAETEACETQVHLEFSLRCSYLDRADVQRLDDLYEHIMAQLILMIQGADHWVINSKSKRS